MMTIDKLAEEVSARLVRAQALFGRLGSWLPIVSALATGIGSALTQSPVAAQGTAASVAFAPQPAIVSMATTLPRALPAVRSVTVT